MNVEHAWYLTVNSLMPSMIIVVINESLNSAVERGPVFLWHDVNILVFYRFPKSFDPNVVFSPASAVHADPHLRLLSFKEGDKKGKVTLGR